MTVDSAPRRYPFEPFTGDLPDELLEMILTNPVSRVLLPDDREAWLVLGYQDCCTVLADPRFSRLARGSEAEATDDADARGLNRNGPSHTSLRRVATRALTARRTEAFRPRVQQRVDELIDAMIAGPRPADLVSGLVAPLPLLVVCDVLGIPDADREQFYRWLQDINAITGYGSADAAEALGEMRVYLAGQAEAKRASPADDLLSAWVGAMDSEEVTGAEVVSLAEGVLIGAIEINTTTAGIRALFQHPEQLRKLLDAPEKVSSATDEMLRYTAVSSMFRVQVVTEDLELSGVAMRAGDFVMAIPWIGNRDPRFFPEPNVFDIDRSPAVPHLTFGYGPHFCAGALLGKMEVELSVGTLLRRLPGLTPAVPVEELPWRHHRVNCGIASFPVVW
jgi:cytochrome P450